MGEGGGGGGCLISNLEHDSNYSVILRLKRSVLTIYVSTNFVADFRYA